MATLEQIMERQGIAKTQIDDAKREIAEALGVELPPSSPVPRGAAAAFAHAVYLEDTARLLRTIASKMRPAVEDFNNRLEGIRRERAEAWEQVDLAREEIKRLEGELKHVRLPGPDADLPKDGLGKTTEEAASAPTAAERGKVTAESVREIAASKRSLKPAK